MKENQKIKKSESGITLIALIVTIALLIILSVVVIRNISGNKGLVKISETAAEENNIVTYKEQIEQKVRSEIASYAARGKEISIEEIGESLREETDWVKTVAVSTNIEMGNEDILATTVEGYVFQIYYNNIYGIVHTEYLGEDDGKAYPTVKARYEVESGNILVEAKEEGSIAKIELISRGETVGNPIQDPSGEVSFNVKTRGTGWYKIKAVANEGKIRYAWVKAINIKDTLIPPDIEADTEGTEVNGWYGGDKKDLYVVISTSNPYAKEIHYTLSGANETEEEVVKELTETEKSVRIKIENSGITRIVATIEDGEGNSSNYMVKDIKYNKEVPVITNIEVTGTKGKNDWYISDVELRIVTEEKNAGYNYTVYDKEENVIKEKTKVTSIEVPIKLERDGEYKIDFEIENLAGSTSEIRRVEIKKDTEEPILQEVKTDSVTIEETSFKIGVAARDNTSGIAYYEYYLNGNKQGPNENTSATYVCEGLTAETEYKVKIVVYDNAGLSIESAEIPVTTAKKGSTGGNNGVLTKADIGRYVNYTPDVGTYPKATLDTYSGVTTNEAITTETDLEWRILDVDEQNVYIMSSTKTNQTLTLRGVLGTVNGEQLFHAICLTCYSNSYVNGKGRHLSIADFPESAISNTNVAKLSENTLSFPPGFRSSPSDRLGWPMEPGSYMGLYEESEFVQERRYLNSINGTNLTFNSGNPIYELAVSETAKGETYIDIATVTLENLSNAPQGVSSALSRLKYDKSSKIVSFSNTALITNVSPTYANTEQTKLVPVIQIPLQRLKEIYGNELKGFLI